MSCLEWLPPRYTSVQLWDWGASGSIPGNGRTICVLYPCLTLIYTRDTGRMLIDMWMSIPCIRGNARHGGSRLHYELYLYPFYKPRMISTRDTTPCETLLCWLTITNHKSTMIWMHLDLVSLRMRWSLHKHDSPHVLVVSIPCLTIVMLSVLIV